MSHNLNIGCGSDVKRDHGIKWVNLDFNFLPGIDLQANLEATLPFKSNTFDLVLASHILEHVGNYYQIVKEIHRVLVPGGILAVRVPEFPCRAAVADPSHIRFFVPESFIHLTDVNLGDVTASQISGLFAIRWLESIPHNRPILDHGVVGSYFTETHVDLEAIKS